MKKFTAYFVIVLIFVAKVFATTTSAVAPEKKEVAVKISPTKVVADPKQDKENIPVDGEKTVKYTITEESGVDLVDQKTGEKIGEAVVQKEKSVVQKNTVAGSATVDFNDTGKKGDGEVIISLVYSPKERVDYNNNGIEIRERPEDLSNLKLGIGYKLGKNVSLGAEVPLGTTFRRISIARNSLGGGEIYDVALTIKGYKDFYFLNLFVEAGLSYTYLSGGYSIGGVDLETDGAGISPLIGFGTEINIERNLNIILETVYEKRKIDTYIPGVPDPLSTGNEGWNLKVGMNYKFQL